MRLHIGQARGGIADGCTIATRYDAGMLVVDKPAGLCQLYTPTGGGFAPAAGWEQPRPVDWNLADDTAAGPIYDVIAHPRAGRSQP